MDERDRISHLFRRAGFGARPEEIEAWAAQGLPAAINRLIDFEATPDNLARSPKGLGDRRAPFTFTGDLIIWWLNSMATTTRPLQEKMVLFWHHLFATSVNNVFDERQMYLQNEHFRGYFRPETGQVARGNRTSPFPVGNFRRILESLTKDPAMSVYLDNWTNFKYNSDVGSNENYARELHELFSMGVADPVTGEPNYTEQDVRQASRALTGWTLRPPRDPEDPFYRQFFFYSDQHDYGPYSHLGKRGGRNADFIFDNIVKHHNPGQQQSAVGRYLGFRLFRFFGYHDPEPEIINALADLFDGADGDQSYSIRNMLRTIFTPGNPVSEAFYSEKAFRSHVKSPTEYVVSAFRLLSPDGLTRLGDYQYPLFDALDQMGQYLLAPPNVAGWKEGLNWMTTTSALARIEFANTMATSLPPEYGGIDVDTALSEQGLDSADQIVTYFTRLLLQGDISEKKRQILTEYLKKPSETGEVDFVNMKVRGLIYLIMTMPEFQLS